MTCDDMRLRRPIVRIDEDKCTGCGLCVAACAEGAIEIANGKARLVGDIYCDGLGACIGECPTGALTIEVRESEGFDPNAVRQLLAPRGSGHGVCPGAVTASLPTASTPDRLAGEPAGDGQSALANWPIQISLLSPTAPYLQGARLLVAADCTVAALPSFHQRHLAGRVLLVGCPKLDDAQAHATKLAAILSANDVESIEVLHMEVPCCTGMVRVVELAIAASGKQVPAHATRVAISGEVISSCELAAEVLAAGLQ